MKHNKLLLKAWEETGKVDFIEALKDFSGENLSKLLGQANYRDLWRKAYNTAGNRDKVLICADERVMPLAGEFKVGIAGQLILASEKDRNNFITRWKGKIKAVRSHDGCGAAAVAYGNPSLYPVIPAPHETTGLTPGGIQKNNFKFFLDSCPAGSLPGKAGRQAGSSVGMTNIDLYGAINSRNLAKALDTKFEHTLFSAMRGYKDFHDARMIFWSADPSFDPTPLLNEGFFPPHFFANGLAFGLSEDYCKEELRILSGIALGDHGFGNLFNKNNPFYIVSVGKDATEGVELNNIAKEVLKSFDTKVKMKFIFGV